ncbi:MAG: 1-(5-phosphoribosyl)-5-[(5-phosphoribosylamino)methylideneamino] imidazole-4-carboxamide isomerase [Terriglobales bacterium]
MLIPSIDLQDGKIVQLVQGKKKAVEFTNFEEWIARFSSYPAVQLIDLDAAMGTGNNRPLVEQLVQRLPCQVGGGIRSVTSAQEILAAGARRVIVGSSLIREGEVDAVFAERLASAVGSDKLVFALDSERGKVSVQGWRVATSVSPRAMLQTLDPWCGGFLYTHIDTEGLMQGIPLEPVRELRKATQKRLMAAGGISTLEQVQQLEEMQVDAIVGMAIYTGRMKA